MGRKKPRIKSPQLPPAEGRIKSPLEGDDETPLWCFKHLRSNYSFENIQQQDAKRLVEGFERRRDKNWADLMRGDAHNGIVACSVSAKLTKPLPLEFKSETTFLKFYVGKRNGRVVGFRRGRQFCVVWIDFQLDVTKH